MWIEKVGVNWKSRTQGNSRIGLKIKKYGEEEEEQEEQEKKKLGSALPALNNLCAKFSREVSSKG